MRHRSPLNVIALSPRLMAPPKIRPLRQKLNQKPIKSPCLYDSGYKRAMVAFAYQKIPAQMPHNSALRSTNHSLQEFCGIWRVSYPFEYQGTADTKVAREDTGKIAGYHHQMERQGSGCVHEICFFFYPAPSEFITAQLPCEKNYVCPERGRRKRLSDTTLLWRG